jgi:hypothetical protein
MGTADIREIGTALPASRGTKRPLQGNFSSLAGRQKILPEPAKPSEIHALASMAKRPRLKRQGPGAVVSQFIERHPTAAIWLIAALQGAVLLGVSALLHALVS